MTLPARCLPALSSWHCLQARLICLCRRLKVSPPASLNVFGLSSPWFAIVLPRDCCAVQNPEHAGVGAVVVLDGARLAAHELVARAALCLLVFRKYFCPCKQQEQGKKSRQPQTTVILDDSVTEKPLSPLQRNSSVPLSVATVEKLMKGFAAIAGNSSARKISSPL